MIPEELQEAPITSDEQTGVRVTHNKDGELEEVYEEPSGPKNAQEVLGKAPQPEQSQEDKARTTKHLSSTEAADWAAEKLPGPV